MVTPWQDYKERERESAWVTLGALGCQLVRGTVSNTLHGEMGRRKKHLQRGQKLCCFKHNTYMQYRLLLIRPPPETVQLGRNSKVAAFRKIGAAKKRPYLKFNDSTIMNHYALNIIIRLINYLTN